MDQSVVHEEKIDMSQLLRFVVTFFSVLFDEHGFLIKGSNNAGNRFSGASILLGSNEVEIFIAIERDEITAHFRSLYDKRKNNWYSSEIILAHLGYAEEHGVLNETNASLIRDQLPEILNCFHEAEVGRTLKNLDDIEKRKSNQHQQSESSPK